MTPPGDPGGDSSEISCDPDNSSSIDSFYEGSFDTALQDTFCPRNDTDYWRFNLSAGKLARIDLEYNKISNVQLAAQWWRPDGRCADANPTPCDDADDCEGLACDPLRGCVAGDAPECFVGEGTECTSPEVCKIAADPLPNESVFENRLLSAPDMHRVVGYFPAFNGGEHFLTVRDQQETEEDDEFQYTLTVVEVDDPDTNEPNNTEFNPTVFTSGETQTRFLSYQLDEDWYVIDPGFDSPAVIDIELRSDATFVSDPTWVITQGEFRLESVEAEIDGSGSGQQRVRRNTLVVPSGEPIFVRVLNRNTTNGTPTISAYNPDEPYSLSISVFEDADEGVNRNDTPTDAEVVSIVAEEGPAVDLTGTIVARNDSDWYQLDTGDFAGSTVPGNNSLVFTSLEASAPEDVGWVLVAQFFKPNGAPCSADIQCAGGLVCAETINAGLVADGVPEGECLDLFVQRPDPQGAGNPELGGLSPNFIQTMLPVHRSKPEDDPRLFLRVAHDPATILPIPGFNQSTSYSLSIRHRSEPDGGDRATRDNDFVARPLRDGDGGNRNPNEFNPEYRMVSSAMISSPSGGSAFAQVVPGTVLNAGDCQALPLEAFNAQGVPSNGNFTVSLTGNLFADCGNTGTPLDTTDVTFVDGVGSVNVVAPAAPMTLDIEVSGRTYFVPTRNGRSISLTGLSGPDFSRAFATGSGSATLRIELPSNPATPKVLSLAAAGGLVACAVDVDGNCEGQSGGTTCTPNGADACNIEAAGGNNSYDIRLIDDGAPGALVLTITDPEGELDTARFRFSTFNPASATLMNNAIQGYISYDGDQDFFRVDVSGVIDAGLTGFVTYPASPVDLRVSLERGDRGVSLGDLDEEDDLDPCDPGSLTPRNTCDQLEKDIERGPGAADAECAYTLTGDTVDVWVNEVFSNDWDLDNTYTVRFELVGGCPSACNAFVCSAEP